MENMPNNVPKPAPPLDVDAELAKLEASSESGGLAAQANSENADAQIEKLEEIHAVLARELNRARV